MADDFLYDVAFSFLGCDESLAVQLNERLTERLSTFIYSDSKRQANLAGRDGSEAFSRVFGAEARTVVILYREGWSERGFTEIEGTALKNRAYKSGWGFAIFIPLDDPPTVPLWVPQTRLWVSMKRWGVDHAATVIEARVQEAGGSPREPTVAEMAARAAREIREAGEHQAFLDSPDGVEAARREFDRLFVEVQRVCVESAGFIVKPERANRQPGFDGCGIRANQFSI